MALKTEARASRWRFAGGAIFAQDGDWFTNVLPSLAWECGVLVRFMSKPMALDPLFWEIVGLPQNNRLPLSFRANGAWVIRPPWEESLLGLHLSAPEDLARLVVQEASRRLEASTSERSVESMLASLASEKHPTGRLRALQICLLILGNRLDAALDLCRTGPEALPFGDSGGFLTAHPDGSSISFLEQAHQWIIAQRRSSIRLA